MTRDADALGTSGHGTPSPSPWRIINTNVYGADAKPAPFTDGDGHLHADFHSGLVALVYRDTEYEADGANARLIAAAPDLLAALQGLNRKRLDGKDGYCVCPFIDSTDAPHHSGTCREARAAIAKATGTGG